MYTFKPSPEEDITSSIFHYDQQVPSKGHKHTSMNSMCSRLTVAVVVVESPDNAESLLK